MKDEGDEIRLIFIDDFIEIRRDGVFDFGGETVVAEERREVHEIPDTFEERQCFREVVASAEQFLELICEQIHEDIDFGQTGFSEEVDDVLLRFEDVRVHGVFGFRAQIQVRDDLVDLGRNVVFREVLLDVRERAEVSFFEVEQAFNGDGCESEERLGSRAHEERNDTCEFENLISIDVISEIVEESQVAADVDRRELMLNQHRLVATHLEEHLRGGKLV